MPIKRSRKFNSNTTRGSWIAVFSMLISAVVISEENYLSPINDKFPKNVYWGDTHLHTNLSIDAYVFGNTSIGPDEAYQFAQGKSIKAHNGMTAKLSRPLDFLVISDHGFNLGLMAGLGFAAPDLLATETGGRLYKEYQSILNQGAPSIWTPSTNEFVDTIYHESEGRAIAEPIRKTTWQKVTQTADYYNNPGKFTAFIGYEWTSSGSSPSGNLHRVVVFDGNSEIVSKVLPFTVYDSTNPEDLWDYFDRYHKTTGGDVLAIPHNGNLSNGEMFPIDIRGNLMQADYAKARSRWEPLYEVIQVKGDSETHPLLSPDDEFADYETWNGWEGAKSIVPETGDKLIARKMSEYARSGLQLGLSKQAELGVNPFKFGLIGSTDSHTGLSTADEYNFWGKFTEPHPERIVSPSWEPFVWKYGEEPYDWAMSAAGYTAVWAEENTRESLFAAMKRKEVYASTGPRITIRFFGGWDYQSVDALLPNFAQVGYSKGVPMGGDLVNGARGKSPSFLIRALKDPDGANLDRVQVIKGWRDSKGQLHEKVYNVALSDDREEGPLGKVPLVGNSVNIKDASYTNSIGDSELAVVWEDPDFNRNELAFYYLRVLEIPTPRWTAYDAKFYDVKTVLSETPMMTQERAYSSPIWYTP